MPGKWIKRKKEDVHIPSENKVATMLLIAELNIDSNVAANSGFLS